MDQSSKLSLFDRITALLGWTPHSIYLMSGFFMACLLIGYIWWPLGVEYLSYIDWNGPWWRYMDWLLLGIFFVMTLLIMSQADLRTDAKIVFVGLVGGLVIESWGTQTNLWFYYTAERPPLWIIPAWPIASLAINRITRLLDGLFGSWSATTSTERSTFSAQGHAPFARISWIASRLIYWLIFLGFYALMMYFVAPTFGKSFTLLSLLMCALFILTPTNYRWAILTFIAGAGLGYFLELWGTTRECWTYYTYQTPPFFAVLAHGMAAVAFWRAQLLLEMVASRLRQSIPRPKKETA